MNVTAFLDNLTADPSYAGQIVARHTITPRPARCATPAEPLPPVLAQALGAQGVDALYTHQAAALDASRAGRDVVVVTGTASGKTLCYNLPVLEALLADRRARALYLFPLKALGRDQLAKLEAFGLWREVRAAAYDGDTPADQRRIVRDAAQIVLTNPDMLHLGLLPHHERWHSFFGGLRYIVLDELHTYRGVFGANVAHVLRRLQRICRLHGTEPRFIGCSATIGNPSELFAALTGRDGAAVIDDDGAPAGRRHIVVWNPPVTEAGDRRRSGNIEATLVLRELARQNIRTLAFALARAEAELILRYLRAALEATDPGLVGQVGVYRAGYLADDRRRVEQELASGALRAVVSTVALEAGIDIGGLDATVLIGYPGSVAGFWQQIGRAGRGSRESLAILVTRESLVDQYFAAHPSALWSAPTESALVDPDNLYVTSGHLLCAAHESPLRDDELPSFGPTARELVSFCAEEGWLSRQGDRWLYTDPAYPAAAVSLRAASNQSYELVNDETSQILGVEDETRLWDVCYPGAICLHDGEQYQVETVDAANRQVHWRPVAVEYFTAAEKRVEVRIDEPAASQVVGGLEIGWGEVTVTKTTVGYRKLRHITFELLERLELDCPPQELATTALWLMPGPELQAWLAAREADLEGGLHAVEHALTGALPLIAMCDPRDVEGATTAFHPQLERPATFLYDGFPGGIGLAERGYAEVRALLEQTRELVERCPCAIGCPACITRQFCGSFNHPLDKLTATVLLRAGCGLDWRQDPSTDVGKRDRES